MAIFRKHIYLIIIIFLIGLLIYGYLLNKKSSASKKNEISNILYQLQIRKIQLNKIQKNLLKNGKNINDLINEKEISFKKIFENKKFTDLDGYSLSKYTTNDILFNGNPRAIGTGFIDFYNDDKKLLITTYDGIFAYSKLDDVSKFKKIASNIHSLINYEKFYFNDQYGIKDILINQNYLYVSYIGQREEDCYDLKIISSELNEDYLDFKLFYQTSNCVDTNNKHEFYPAQGAGGRMYKFDSSNILFTTGEFRNRPLAQNLRSDFGKILKINVQNKKSEVVSLGHRNPQGLYYSEKFNFILSTEHGPKGGDEININHNPLIDIKNFGWPISSYGEHYAKHYSEKKLKEAPLNKSHKKFGFVEPLKYFVPSIGISQAIPIDINDTEFLVGAMGNEIKDQDLGIHYIKLNKDRKKIADHKYISFNERVRDMIVSKNRETMVIFLETTSTLIFIKKSDI